jgi:hypothetical protein
MLEVAEVYLRCVRGCYGVPQLVTRLQRYARDGLKVFSRYLRYARDD